MFIISDMKFTPRCLMCGSIKDDKQKHKCTPSVGWTKQEKVKRFV